MIDHDVTKSFTVFFKVTKTAIHIFFLLAILLFQLIVLVVCIATGKNNLIAELEVAVSLSSSFNKTLGPDREVLLTILKSFVVSCHGCIDTLIIRVISDNLSKYGRLWHVELVGIYEACHACKNGCDSEHWLR